MPRKERDDTFPGWIQKTKSKHYIAICQICNEAITPVLTFRIQASQQLRAHLEKEHKLYS